MGTHFKPYSAPEFRDKYVYGRHATLAIMKITGHKTERSFLRYIKITQEDNAKKMLQHPLFKQSVLKIAN